VLDQTATGRSGIGPPWPVCGADRGTGAAGRGGDGSRRRHKPWCKRRNEKGAKLKTPLAGNPERRRAGRYDGSAYTLTEPCETCTRIPPTPVIQQQQTAKTDMMRGKDQEGRVQRTYSAEQLLICCLEPRLRGCVPRQLRVTTSFIRPHRIRCDPWRCVKFKVYISVSSGVVAHDAERAGCRRHSSSGEVAPLREVV